MNELDCTAFLQWALPQINLRWPGFRKVRRQVCKRLKRRMHDLQLADFAAYRARLENDPTEWEAVDRCCHITISRFFGDRGVFEALRRRAAAGHPAARGNDLLVFAQPIGNGNVSGNGSAKIDGSATLEFGAAASSNTTFDPGATGTLKLDQSSTFSGAVSGFTAGDKIDLADIAFASTFVPSSADHGGTSVVNPPSIQPPPVGSAPPCLNELGQVNGHARKHCISVTHSRHSRSRTDGRLSLGAGASDDRRPCGSTPNSPRPRCAASG